MTSLKTSIKTITYLSDIGCLEIQGASLASSTAAGGEVMDSFAKYTIIDWIAFLQVLLIWFYMAYRSGQWIVSVACSKGWRWWNRKNKKALALDSFYEAFNLNSLQPGSVIVVTTQSGMTIQIHKPKEEK